MLKIKKNDEVVVTTGKDSGKRGKVTNIVAKGNKVVVGGLNMVKRHLKRKSEKDQSQIVSKEMPIDISNVTPICPHCSKKTKVGFQMEGKTKTRYCKKCKKNF